MASDETFVAFIRDLLWRDGGRVGLRQSTLREADDSGKGTAARPVPGSAISGGKAVFPGGQRRRRGVSVGDHCCYREGIVGGECEDGQEESGQAEDGAQESGYKKAMRS
jgi:hypothetical protein